ncbi:hypothetical protein AB6A40_001222 [Gnathostoma spinigerum]|uniref:Uncharacterized protein n=1 Tax=Gnathostoma spinigerum TaxID=75299 RepID=A0ABD6E3N5_9BILA
MYHNKSAKRSENISLVWLLNTIPILLVTAICPLSEDIPRPICAFLFAEDECSGDFHAIREDEEQWDIGEVWNDRAYMAVIRPDCYLDVYDGLNLTESHRFLGGGLSENNVYDLSWYSFHNRTTSYTCVCTTL